MSGSATYTTGYSNNKTDREFYRLKEQVRDVEIIKKATEYVERENGRDVHIRKSKDMEL